MSEKIRAIWVTNGTACYRELVKKHPELSSNALYEAKFPVYLVHQYGSRLDARSVTVRALEDAYLKFLKLSDTEKKTLK